MTDLLAVRRYVWHPNHRRFYCHGTTVYTTVGPYHTIGRAFACAACGEALLDGDRGYDTDRGFVHENCHQETAHV